MSGVYTLYGWHLSYFTGKAMCYLRYRGVPFEQKAVDMLTLMWRIKRKTGAAVMPVMVTPDGEWINDTSRIIDYVEARATGPSIHPPTPVQRFASYLMEAWGDEWWIPMAMHTRWSYPENYALFERDAGRALLPAFPGWAQRRAVKMVATKLRGMLHTVGVRPEQHGVMNAWMGHMLTLLDTHFAQHRYLFGDCPSLGDFGLVGTMYGHLGRDPWPARELIAARPHLRAWIDRMAEPPVAASTSAGISAGSSGWVPDDQIAPTLLPVFQAIVTEFVPLLEGINGQVKAQLANWPRGKLLPRRLADVEVPMGRDRFGRAALPYSLWMAQRVLNAHRAMTAAEQAQVRAWLASIGAEGEAGGAGGERLLDMDVPRLRLHGVRVGAAAL